MNPRCSLVLLLALTLGACAPKYPSCSRDQHCRSGEVCVNGTCQQCRVDGDCPAGQRCQKGRCETAASAACKDDAACGPGKRCLNGSCVAADACRQDSDCPAGQECQSGVCKGPPPEARTGPCIPPPIYFDFDEHLLTVAATRTLGEEVAPCLRKAARKVRIEGHCDPHGTEEYNLALGEKRALSVRRYLQRVGLEIRRLRTLSKGKLEATGTDESSWARDRRAQFAWE